jgi:hypothetical protein
MRPAGGYADFRQRATALGSSALFGMIALLPVIFCVSKPFDRRAFDRDIRSGHLVEQTGQMDLTTDERTAVCGTSNSWMCGILLLAVAYRINSSP